MTRSSCKTISGKLLGRLSVLTLALGLIATVSLVGCATPSASSSGSTPSQAPQTAAAASARDIAGGDYQIGPEDVLDISVWREKDLQQEVLVRPDGWLTFPLVGAIEAAGKTPAQLQKEITTRLKKYIPDPVVTVTVKKIQGLKIFVIGKVGKPGEYNVGRYVDVLQALTLAGGLTPFAKETDIRILRKHNGREQVIPFDYSQVKRGNNLQQNIMLRSGDVVVVP